MTSTLTAAAFAAEVRRAALTELEARRAGQPDQSGTLPRWQPSPPLDPALATRLGAFADEPDTLRSDLPTDLAADLRQALEAVRPARH